jgi:pimeloyl-ACP methyl ester carboxylesterase
MPRAPIRNQLELEYEVYGNPADPAVLLIAGLGMHLVEWTEAFWGPLVDAGFYVIVFDNRDGGLSTKLEHLPVPNELINGLKERIHSYVESCYDPIMLAMLVALGFGKLGDLKVGTAFLLGMSHFKDRMRDMVRPNPEDVPYSLMDMAMDGFLLLDHLGIAHAHVMGTSMGGMIAQQMAIAAPHRVSSMTLLSTAPGPGNGPIMPSIPWYLKFMVASNLPNGLNSTEEEQLDAHMRVARIIQGRKYFNSERIRERRRGCLHRLQNGAKVPLSVSNPGIRRQIGALMTAASRLEELREVCVRRSMPAMVIHGAEDVFVHLQNGELMQRTMPGSRLVVVADMGHTHEDEHCPAIMEQLLPHLAAISGRSTLSSRM